MHDPESSPLKPPIDLIKESAILSPASVDLLFKYYDGKQLKPLLDRIMEHADDHRAIKQLYEQDQARVIDFNTYDPKDLSLYLKWLRKDRGQVFLAIAKNIADPVKREIAKRYLKGIGSLIELMKDRQISAKSRAKSE